MRRGLLKRGRCDWITRILLVTLVLRAFIPLGFMPMFSRGYNVQLVLCEGYAPLPSKPGSMPMDMGTSMPAGMSMDMPIDDGSRSHAHQDHNNCPFGASPTAAILPLLNVVLPTVQVPALLTSRCAQISYLKISPRAQSPRGPPLEV